MDEFPRVPIEATHPHVIGFLKYLNELNRESPRGAVLISCAVIDDQLCRTIRSFLLDYPESGTLLEGFNAPLGTFSSRIVAAYALGLVSEVEFRECNLLRKVRNAFAHGVHVSFEDAKIVGICDALKMAAPATEVHNIDARGKFTTSAVSLILGLTNRPYYVATKRLQHGQWPY
jgi:mannitol operon repressor